MVKLDGNTTGDEVVKAFAAEAKGKAFLITGPSKGGIGGQTAVFLAAGKPKLNLLAWRSLPKVQPVIEEIKKSHPDVPVTFIKLDLASQASIREAAKQVNSKVDKLDVLINNAGVMAVKDYMTTVEGIELQFGANHIGHFLLTNLLMDKDPCSRSRSKDHQRLQFWLPSCWSMLRRLEFQEKLKSKGALAFSLNPGLITDTKLQTNVTPEMFADGYKITVEALNGEEMPFAAMAPVSIPQGTATTLWAALDPNLSSHSGAFLTRCEVWNQPLRAHAVGKENQDKLWVLSEKLVGEKFEYA